MNNHKENLNPPGLVLAASAFMVGYILLVVNKLVYYWVFLPRFHKENPETQLGTFRQVVEYLCWMPGCVMTILTVIAFISVILSLGLDKSRE